MAAARYGIPLAIGTVGSWIVGTMFAKEEEPLVYVEEEPLEEPYPYPPYPYPAYPYPPSQYPYQHQTPSPSPALQQQPSPPKPEERTVVIQQPPPPPPKPEERTVVIQQPPPPPPPMPEPQPVPQLPPPPPMPEPQPMPENVPEPEPEPEIPEPGRPSSFRRNVEAEPEPVTPETVRMWSDSQCIDYLGNLNIRDRRAFRQWSRANHPDKGGDPQLFANVSSCADRLDRLFPPEQAPVPEPAPASASEPTPEPTPNPAPEPAPVPEPSPPTSSEDCTNPELYFENSATGDCLFESFAQIYYPIDKRVNSPEYAKVLETARNIRTLLANAYEYVDKNDEIRRRYSIPSQITDIENRAMSLKTYADHIKRPGVWATDTDLEVLSRVLGIPFHVVEHSPEGETIVRDISAFGTTPSESEYYTMCNIDDRHWVLKKHAAPLPLHESIAAMSGR